MSRNRSLTLIAVAALALTAAVPVAPAFAAAQGSATTSTATALPPLGAGDWTGSRNRAAGGGWNSAETTIGPADAAGLHIVRSYPGLDNASGGEVGATGHGMFYTGLAGGGIAAYDEVSGTLRWSAPVGSQQLTVGDSAVITVTGGNGLAGTGSGSVSAYNAGSGHQLWLKAIPRVLDMAPPTLLGSRVLVAWNARAGRLAPAYVASYDVATGRKIWQIQLPNAGPSTFPHRVSSVSAQDGVGVVTIANGSAVAFDLSSGAQRWTLDVGGVSASLAQSRPVIRGGVVYLSLVYGASSGVVKALALRTGVQSWSRNFGGQPTGLADADGVLYLGTDVEGLPAGTPDLYALSGNDGTTIWSAEIGSSSVPPTIANGVLYVSPVLGATRLMTLNAATGTTIGTVALPFFDYAEAAVSNGRVYVYVGNGQVSVLTPS